MNYLHDVARLISESNHSKELMKTTVERESKVLSVLVRPYLTEEQNGVLSTCLESIISTCADCAFNIGYNEVLQRFAEAEALSKPYIFPQQ